MGGNQGLGKTHSLGSCLTACHIENKEDTMLISEPTFVQIADAIENGVRIELGTTAHDHSIARAYHETELIAECKGTYTDLTEVLTELDNLLYDWNAAIQSDRLE